MMTLQLYINSTFVASKESFVNSVDLHSNASWMLLSLESGHVKVWDYESQLQILSQYVCDCPVTVGRFIPRKFWIITGSDDKQIRVFNYNNLEQIHIFEAHSDCIRSILIHPTKPLVLTSSDGIFIKLWSWEKKWSCKQVFKGHSKRIMQIVFNPKDNNIFASASLDLTVKVWQLGSSAPNFTLEGHEKGVNCVDYCHGRDKPYLISGSDDRLVKIWDYQNKTCIQTLEGHAQNISAVIFHPELPIIMTGAVDGTVRIWHSNTYKIESTFNYDYGNINTIAYFEGSSRIALSYDENSIIIKINCGLQEPAMSMDSSGKIIWAKKNELQQARLRTMTDADIKDGDKMPLIIKYLGNCKIYPQTISHNPNGRFVVVCGDGKYIVYTAIDFKIKSSGSAQEFVWALDSSEYAVQESSTSVKIFKNFKEKRVFKPEYEANGIFGGNMLGVRSTSGLAFYDWERLELIHRIEIQPKYIYWSEYGKLLCIATEDSFRVLKYNADAVVKPKQSQGKLTEDGIKEVFDVIGMHAENIKKGLWIGDYFIYTNIINRLNCYGGGKIVTIAHLDGLICILGYIAKYNRLYVGNAKFFLVSYSLLMSELKKKPATRTIVTAHSVLPSTWQEEESHYMLKVNEDYEDPKKYHHDVDLKYKIRRQFEYYFSAFNLDTDKFMREHMNKDGFILITLIATFPKIIAITKDIDLILQAIVESDSLEVKDYLVRTKFNPKIWPLPNSSETSIDLQKVSTFVPEKPFVLTASNTPELLDENTINVSKNTLKSPVRNKKKASHGQKIRKRCQKCEPCKRKDCLACINCKDKSQYGGLGIRKQCCVERQCIELKQASI